MNDAADILAVECRAVSKSFGSGPEKVMAVHDLDLEVQRGELCMLVGPSGCGKTTLISIMAGTLDQDSGECRVFGRDIVHLRQREKNAFRAKNIGFVFQAFNLLPALNAFENVAVPLLLNSVPRRKANEIAKDLLVKVGLEPRMKALPSQLSGGQQQRVAIARALVHNPGLIVCDEPTSALDHVTGGRVMDLLRSVALDGGRTLVIVTHDARILHYADRIAYMDDGRITQIEDKHAIQKEAARV